MLQCIFRDRFIRLEVDHDPTFLDNVAAATIDAEYLVRTESKALRSEGAFVDRAPLLGGMELVLLSVPGRDRYGQFAGEPAAGEGMSRRAPGTGRGTPACAPVRPPPGPRAASPRCPRRRGSRSIDPPGSAANTSTVGSRAAAGSVIPQLAVWKNPALGRTGSFVCRMSIPAEFRRDSVWRNDGRRQGAGHPACR